MAEYIDISVNTKAAIIESIMGLGIIYAEKYEELEDIPDIINEIEKGLRSFNNRDYQHKKRGQHTSTEVKWEEVDE
eukprot:3885735-Heterocapsa_arctica.AAC.1